MDQHRFGRCVFDAASRTLGCDGVEFALRGKMAELLALLLERPNEVIANDRLRQQLWPDGYVETGNLAQQVYLLRRTLAVDPTVSVENVARRGYRLRTPVPTSPASHRKRSIRLRIVAAALAAAFVVVLPGGSALLGTGARNVDTPGAQAYALGRYFLGRRGIDNLRRAKVFFEASVEAAPASALGYAGLAEVWGIWADDVPVGTREHAALAQRALADANAAVARDPNSAAAHASLGLALLEMQRPELRAPPVQALTELRRAIDIDPRNADAQEWYAIQMLFTGNLRDALRYSEAALQAQPENVAVTSWYALIKYYLRDERGAVSGFRTALEINPSYDLAQLGLVAALVDHGRYRDAQRELRRVHAGSRSTDRALRALAVIVDLRLGLRGAAESQARRLHVEDLARGLGDDDGFVVAALALDGRRGEARRLRARMHPESNPYVRLMIDLDPLVSPVLRSLGGDV